MKFFSKPVFILTVTAMLGLVTLPVIAAPSYDPTKIGEKEYWKLVQDSLDAIKRLEGLSEEETKQTLASLASQWKTANEVEVNGQVTPVDSEYLSELMLAEQPDLEKIEGLLNSLLMAHQTYPQGVFSGAELDPLHNILSRPEFAWPEAPATNPVTEWLQKIWTSINRWLNDLFGRSFDISVDQNWLTLIATVLLALVFYFVFRTLFIDFSREARLHSEGSEENEPLTSETAFEKAQRLSRGGDYRSAVRYLYLSALLIMDERGVLRYDRSKTNREYLRSVAGATELAEPLGEVIEVFDNVWYGYHSLDEDSFQHYSNRVGELKEKA
jgi:hypothetical protein